jgi:small-conductance mechanosensitive channel
MGFAMNDLKVGEHDLLSYLKPDSFIGAIAYLVIFVVAAMLLSRALRAAVHAAMTRKGHMDHTTISFLQQMATVLIWVVLLILYAHLIPVLRSMGTALLAGASVASVVIGLAAQSTLGNLVAGVSITIYRPGSRTHRHRHRRRGNDFAGIHDTACGGWTSDHSAQQYCRHPSHH